MTLTLRERLLLELWHFTLTERHLDIDMTCLCGGSNTIDGFGVAVTWNPENCALWAWRYPKNAASEICCTRAILS